MRTAEAHLLGGDADAALALASDLIGRAERGEGVGVLMPTLLRIRGQAIAATGDLGAARETMDLSLEDARQRNSPYDAALALSSLAELARATGRGDADGLTAEARAVLDRLGVIADSVRPEHRVARTDRDREEPVSAVDV